MRPARASLAWAALLAAGFACAGGRTASAASPPRVDGGDACARLAALRLPGARITVAEAIAPHPQWPFPASVFNGFATTQGPDARAVRVPFCRIAGVIGEEVRFEVWLPDKWNGRFQGVGNGGLAGDLNYPAMGLALADGYATASTDTGHRGGLSDTAWIAGHPQRVVDFGHRAHHLMAVAAKQVVAAYYRRPARYSYFNGCSAGGWQGLTEAQKYPGDYDGIVAGAPWIGFVRYAVRDLATRQQALLDPDGEIPDAKVPLLTAAAVSRCDPQDGVKDGVIGDPERCDFEPAQSQCARDDDGACLTAAQVARARDLYGPSPGPRGLRLYPGAAHGAPPFTSFPEFLSNRDMSIIRAQENTAMAKMLRRPPAWNALTFETERDLPALERELGPILDSDDPDLGRFRARGGKLILYHGWLDTSVSPYVSVDYYRRALAANGPDTAGFFRLFMVPGMGHCLGGPGTDVFDKLAPLTQWRERGVAPDSLPAAHLTDGKPDRRRPLCPYPQVARYGGAGDTDQAESFSCKVP